MADQPGSRTALPNPTRLASSLADIGERSQRLIREWMIRNGVAGSRAAISDSLEIASSFADLTTRMMADPAHLAQAQVSLWQAYMNLWQNTAVRMLGVPAQPAYQPTQSDRRFRHPHWQENEIFNYIKQSYLLVSRWLEQTIHDVEGLDNRTKQRVEFYTRQFINAVSPSNFAFTNPEVIQATIETGGENLINGLRNLLVDLEQGRHLAAVGNGDRPTFVVGHDLATTPGRVIFRNEVMELIQYLPRSETVLKRPLLFVPPWSHKYYIADLDEGKSWVRWTVEQGHTVFLVSWINPGERQADMSLEDYLVKGPVQALDVIRQHTGESEVDGVGYCLGGTLLAITMAWLTAKGDDRIRTGSFLATMLDFAEPGELGVFIDEATMAYYDNRRDFSSLRVDDMVSTVNLLRENDLIWSFVVNNYLLGNDPFPVELLYWNSDANRVPKDMHEFYLRTVYRQNKLAEKGGLTIAGVPVDLSRITVPTYFLAAREDHIAPWRSTYKGMRLLSGPVRFTLAGSGHIAGVINPPGEDAHAHWASDRTAPPDPESWLSQAGQRAGSWWVDWQAWVKRSSRNERVAARMPGSNGLPVLGDAPGTYVHMR